MPVYVALCNNSAPGFGTPVDWDFLLYFARGILQYGWLALVYDTLCAWNRLLHRFRPSAHNEEAITADILSSGVCSFC